LGQLVSKGQIVARMSQPELGVRLEEARAALDDLLERH
jgi:hypothetical protein